MSDIPLVPEAITPLPKVSEKEGLLTWVASVDHKLLGIMYLITSVFFFLVGGLEALAIRAQLSSPNNTFLSPEAYNQIFTMHGTTMVFLVVMPLMIGFGVYLVPLMIGTRDMAFPRLNALSFWLFFFGGLMLYYSFVAGGAPDAGWFSYAPLSERPYATTNGVDYWAVGLLSIGIGSLAGGINFVVTILTMRAPGMKLTSMPMFVWTTLINGVILVGALPPLNAALVMLEFDRQLGAHFFRTQEGGSSLLWQHYFWAFGHPEVYIMILPGFGMISEIIPVFSRKPLFGYVFVAGSTVAIMFLSFAVYAHHMFTVGLGPAWEAAFGFSSMLIAVPTGIKIFNWCFTMIGGRIRFTTPMLFCTSFLLMFTIGGITGVLFSVVPIDWQTHNSYFVVAHMHYVLFGGSAFALFGGAYYWFPKITGKMLSEKLGKLHFWLTFIGFNMTFFIQHILGIIGMPRRIYTYPNIEGWGWMNLLSSVGAVVLAVSVIVFILNVFLSLAKKEKAPANPWDAWTLEWATTSPPPIHNFDQLPPIRGRRPLWDLKYPDDQDWARTHKTIRRAAK